MTPDRKILQIRNIFEGDFFPGTNEMKKIGRYSDAFACIVKGKVEYIFNDRSFIATPDKFFYLPKGSKYAMRIIEQSKYVCIDFDFDRSYPNDFTLINTDKPNIKNEFELAFRRWVENAPWRDARAMSTAYTLYAEAIKSFSSIRTDTKKQFRTALDILLERYTDSDFTVRELSEKLSISEVHLRRIFNSNVGTSPIKYINNLRLEKAKYMLLSTDYSVEKIAFLCGFSDPYYFSRIFRKEFSIPPSRYRSKQI